MSLIPIIPGPNNELITQSLAVPPRYAITADTSSYSFYAERSRHTWGSWYSTDEQTASLANTAYPITVNTLIDASGFTISGSNGGVSGSVIVVPINGTYNFQFSIQLYNSTGNVGGNEVTIWLRVNGLDVAWSSGQVSVIPNYPYVVASWNFLNSYNAGDKIELMWASTNTGIIIKKISVNPPSPEVPSVILTIEEL